MYKYGLVLYKNNKPHQTDVVYSINGICTALLSTNYKNPPRILIKASEKIAK